MREPNYYNVIVDWHLYQFQFPKYSTNEHVAAARAWELTIEEYDPIHPIIVGTYVERRAKYIFSSRILPNIENTISLSGTILRFQDYMISFLIVIFFYLPASNCFHQASGAWGRGRSNKQDR